MPAAIRINTVFIEADFNIQRLRGTPTKPWRSGVNAMTSPLNIAPAPSLLEYSSAVVTTMSRAKVAKNPEYITRQREGKGAIRSSSKRRPGGTPEPSPRAPDLGSNGSSSPKVRERLSPMLLGRGDREFDPLRPGKVSVHVADMAQRRRRLGSML